MQISQSLSIIIMALMMFENSFGLTNSTPAEDQFAEAVVMIKTEDQNQQGDGVPAFCNATFLSEELLITAAHCVIGNHLLGLNKVEIQVGRYKYLSRTDGTRRRIGYVPFFTDTFSAKYAFFPSLQRRLPSSFQNVKIGPNEDIAFIELASPVQIGNSLIVAKVISQNHLRGSIDKIMNYWPTVVSQNLFAEMSTDTKRWARLDHITSTSPHIASKSTSRVEEGDSGSPLFLRIGTDWYLVGITKGRAESFFSNWDVFGLLDSRLCDRAIALSEKNKKLLCY